jgi:hypothetical protein
MVIMIFLIVVIVDNGNLLCRKPKEQQYLRPSHVVIVVPLE